MTTDATFTLSGPAVKVRLVADDTRRQGRATLLECSQFMFDLNLAYEISRMVTDRRYSKAHFSPSTFSRSGRRLDEDDRLLIGRVSFNSPLEIVAYATGTLLGLPSALWMAVQIFDKIRAAPVEHALRKENLAIAQEGRQLARLNVQKAKLEIEKLHRELEPDSPPIGVTPESLQSNEARRAVQRAEERLRESPLEVAAIDVDFIKRLEA